VSALAPAPTLEADTVREALRVGRRLLAPASETAGLDAELLLARALGVEREQLVLAVAGSGRGGLECRPGWRQTYTSLLARRRAGEPVAYLVGRRAFRRLELAVDSRALIPRPESELLVEAALALPSGWLVADVGTGCGAIALAIKEERPDLEVVGVERSAAALSLARENGRRLALAVRFVEGDLLEGLDPLPQAVVANLPYVPEGTDLPIELSYEPPEALYGGADGLAVIRRLVEQLSVRPAVRFVALEVGAGQAEAVRGLLAAAGFGELAVRRDLAGIERVVSGVRLG